MLVLCKDYFIHMFIQCSKTPNPNTRKFIITDIKIATKTVFYDKQDDYSNSPLANVLFTIEHIKSILFGNDFISITKAAHKEWGLLKQEVTGILVDFFHSKKPAVIITKQNIQYNGVEKEIVEIIETKIRPAVSQDGGEVVFHEFTNNTVYLKLQGACHSCPSAAITLKQGIESMLQYYVPEVKKVKQVF